MGVFDFFRRARETRMVTSLTGGPAEDGWRPLGYSASGAEGLATVLGCVGVISSSVASLPTLVYRRDADGRRSEAPDHSLARLIANGPNPHQTWSDLIEWTIASALLDGNALVELVTNERGEVVEMRPIPWRSVAVQQLPSGRLAFDFNEPAIGGAQGQSRRLLQGEVFHLKDRGDNAFVGVSRLRRAAGVAEGALLVDSYAKSLWRNLGRPGVVLKHDKTLSEGAAQRLKTNWVSLYGGDKRGSPAVLEEGLDVTTIPQVSPEDAELLAARRFTVEELARIFQVPPPMIGDLSHGTLNNSETMLRYFAQSTLTWWVRKVEDEFARSVFSEAERGSYEIDFDMSGLLRGDPETRWESWKIAIDAGVLSPDEVRGEEGWGPRETPPAREPGVA